MPTPQVSKISLIDQLSLSGSYNLAADSFQWSNLSASLRLKLTKSYLAVERHLRYPYVQRKRTAQHSEMASRQRLRSMATQTSFSLHSIGTLSKWFGDKDEEGKTTGRQRCQRQYAQTQSDENNLNDNGGRLFGPKERYGRNRCRRLFDPDCSVESYLQL